MELMAAAALLVSAINLWEVKRIRDLLRRKGLTDDSAAGTGG